MTFLRSVALRPDAAGETGYPFDLPLIRALPERDLSAPATFFVGENGSGKSTLLEALAASARMVTIGGAPIHADPTMLPAQRLGTCLRLSWKRKTRSGFFLRAEDFIGYTRQVAGMLAELDEIAEAAKADGQRDWWRAYELAKGERAQLRRGLGDDFDARSHGESFLDLFQRQLRDNGLHLLDEPETPLSPQRQLALREQRGHGHQRAQSVRQAAKRFFDFVDEFHCRRFCCRDKKQRAMPNSVALDATTRPKEARVREIKHSIFD